MTENSSNNPQSPSNKNSFSKESHTTLGKYLKDSRLKQNKSIEEAAEATRIHASTIKALEEDNRSKLPAEVFTRGFIKIYASYLGLSPHEALQKYDQKSDIQWTVADEKINAQEVLSSETLAESPRIITSTKIFLLMAAVVVFFFGYYLYKTYQSLPKPVEEINTSLTESSSSPALSSSAVPADATADAPEAHEENAVMPQDIAPQERALPMEQKTTAAAPKNDASVIEKPAKLVDKPAAPPAESRPAPEKKSLESTSSSSQPHQQESKAAELEPAAAMAGSQQKKETEANVIATEPNETVAVKETAEETPSASSAQEGTYNYTLEAKFSEMTWMRVQIDEQQPREYTYHPGAEYTWKAKDKMEIFIGNAGGVALTLNDEPLAPLGKSGQIYKLSIPATPNP